MKPNMVIGLDIANEVIQTIASLMMTIDLEMFLVVSGDRMAM
jgi:hypothetical protein